MSSPEQTGAFFLAAISRPFLWLPSETPGSIGLARFRPGLFWNGMPKANVTIRFSDGAPIFAYPRGAQSAAAASAPSAQSIANDIAVSVTGAAVSADAGIAVSSVGDPILTWTGDFETGDFSQYRLHLEGGNDQNIVTNPTRGGTYAAEMIVTDNNLGVVNRSELKTYQLGIGDGQKVGGIMRFIWNGPEYWIGFSHYFAEVPWDTWAFFQVHAPDTTNPQCRRSGNSVCLVGEPRGDNLDERVCLYVMDGDGQVPPGAPGMLANNIKVAEWPIVTGEWTDYVIKLHISTTNNGYCTVWKNGVQVYAGTGLQNCNYIDQCGVEITDDARHNGIHTGLYASSDSGYRRIFIDECRIAEGSGGYSLVDPVTYRGPR